MAAFVRCLVVIVKNYFLVNMSIIIEINKLLSRQVCLCVFFFFDICLDSLREGGVRWAGTGTRVYNNQPI